MFPHNTEVIRQAFITKADGFITSPRASMSCRICSARAGSSAASGMLAQYFLASKSPGAKLSCLDGSIPGHALGLNLSMPHRKSVNARLFEAEEENHFYRPQYNFVLPEVGVFANPCCIQLPTKFGKGSHHITM